MYKVGSNYKNLLNNTSLTILHYLVNPENDETSVRDVCQHTGLEHSQVSHTLSLLHSVGIVTAKRQGKFKFYKLRSAALVASIDEVERQFKELRRKYGSGAEK